MTKKKNIQASTNSPIPKVEKVIVESTKTNSKFSSKKILMMCSILIAVVTFAVFYNSIGNRFVLDDHGIIKSNKITKAGITVDNIKRIFTTAHRAGDVTDKENSLYRPLVKLIFAAEWQASNNGDTVNGNPHFFHFWNIVFMMLCCLALFYVLYDALNKNWIIALFTTLLFAVHPIHSEVVANVKSLDEILGTLGILLGIRCFQIYIQNNKTYWILLAALSYLVALFSKESSVVAVALVPLVLYYFTKANNKQIVISGVIMGICAVFFLAFRYMAIGKYHMEPPSALDNVLALARIPGTENYFWSMRFPTVVAIMGKYLYTLFYPYPLSCDYSYASINISTFSSMDFWISFLVYGCLIYYTIKTFKQKSIIGFAVLWFLISSSIISNMFMVIGTSFGERLMFMPSIAWCLAIVAFLYQIFKYKDDILESNFMTGLKKHSALLAILIVIGFVYSLKTMSRNTDWYSDRKLFSTDVEKFPESTHLLFYWGNHISSSEYAEGKSAPEVTEANNEAKRVFQHALSIFPALPSDGYNQYGKAFYNTGFPDSAMKYYQKAYQEDTTNSVFMNNIGTIYFARQQYDSAMKYFQLAYLKDSTTIDYLNNLGAIHGTLAHRDEAIKWFSKAYQLDSISPGGILALKSLAMTYNLMGDSNTAKSYTLKAQQITQARQDKVQSQQQ